MFRKITDYKVNKSQNTDDRAVFIYDDEYVIKIKKYDHSISDFFYKNQNSIYANIEKVQYNYIFIKDNYILYKYNYLSGDKQLELSNIHVEQLISFLESLSNEKNTEYVDHFFENRRTTKEYMSNNILISEKIFDSINRKYFEQYFLFSDLLDKRDDMKFSLIVRNLNSSHNLLFKEHKITAVLDINYGIDYIEGEILEIIFSYGYNYDNSYIKRYNITAYKVLFFLIRKLQKGDNSYTNEYIKLIKKLI